MILAMPLRRAAGGNGNDGAHIDNGRRKPTVPHRGFEHVQGAERKQRQWPSVPMKEGCG